MWSPDDSDQAADANGADANGDVVTQGVWIEADDQPLAGWLSHPAGGLSGSAILILPPAGYEYWTAHRTLRVLAERLARLGHTALRIDYHGVGDSAGQQTEPARWEAWRSVVAAGVNALRACGAAEVTLVGLRLGASIALLEAADAQAVGVVAAFPPISGRGYARELAMISARVPDPPPDGVPAGTVVNAGTVFTPETVQALGTMDLTSLERSPAARVLLCDRDDRPRSDRLAAALHELGCDVERQLVSGMVVALDRPTEEAEAANDLIEKVCAWIGEAGDGQLSPLTGELPLPVMTPMRWGSGVVCERFVRIGPSRLVAIQTSAGADPFATVVLLNSGSEPHIGPGRAWVELARTLALAGLQVLRVDFRGWGESPDGAFAPGRPYDAHTWQDAADIADALRDSGAPPVILAGVCAGAWAALRAATTARLGGVIAINPQLYWQPGDPVEALISDTRKRRLAEIEHFKLHGHELERTQPHPAAAWLSQLQTRGVPVLIVSSEHDDGVEFLESRLPSAWAQALASGLIELVTVPIDHGLHRYWEREQLIAPIVDFASAVASEI